MIRIQSCRNFLQLFDRFWSIHMICFFIYNITVTNTSCSMDKEVNVHGKHYHYDCYFCHSRDDRLFSLQMAGQKKIVVTSLRMWKGSNAACSLFCIHKHYHYDTLLLYPNLTIWQYFKLSKISNRAFQSFAQKNLNSSSI